MRIMVICCLTALREKVSPSNIRYVSCGLRNERVAAHQSLPQKQSIFSGREWPMKMSPIANTRRTCSKWLSLWKCQAKPTWYFVRLYKFYSFPTTKMKLVPTQPKFLVFIMYISAHTNAIRRTFLNTAFYFDSVVSAFSFWDGFLLLI